MEVAVGSPVPPHTPHAISVSLPKWLDVVGYEEGEKRIVDCMLNGYPRFFIHLTITKVLEILVLFNDFSIRQRNSLHPSANNDMLSKTNVVCCSQHGRSPTIVGLSFREG